MKTFQLALAALWLTPAAAQLSRAVPCPSPNEGVIGYTTIADINADQVDEVARIQADGNPATFYDIDICPGTSLDATDGPLVPLLSATTFQCGSTQFPASDCSVTGGDIQVDVGDLLVCSFPDETCAISNGSPGSDAALVGMERLTFTSWSEVAISGEAGSETVVELVDGVFQVRACELAVDTCAWC